MYNDMDYSAFETINKNYCEFWEMNENDFTFDENIALDDCEHYE